MFFSQVKEGVIKYAQNEIINKAEGAMKFVLYTGVALAVPKLDEMYNQFKTHPILKALDVIKPNDEIDTDKLHLAMKQAISQIGRFEYMGIIFNAQDIDNLFKYINQGGVKYETQANEIK